MKYLTEPKKTIWVASNLEKRILIDRILNSDACLSDMDDTDTKSTASIVVIEGVKRYFYNPHFIQWWLKIGWDQLTKRQKLDSNSWADYNKLFLDEKEKRRIARKVTPKKIKKLLFPGVEEFYSLIKTQKVYITRNLHEISSAFGELLNFDQVISRSRNKEQSTISFIETHPQFCNYIVKGDSVHDEGMIDALKFYQKKGRINSITGIWVSKTPTENPKFDVNIGQDYRGLVELLKKEKPIKLFSDEY
ncbi:hypothetical protein COV11_02475 [Candidatus Woesearchaeota archaeon CG10_big_fil_rev_8_21_14_0_10_30_7]|nr:MAG: hypothetical protein COV11_02475 [Candidatus Woesearchaeota archaeon CG10_big_fil_rev_8_21_14_0_10_30_7]